MTGPPARAGPKSAASATYAFAYAVQSLTSPNPQQGVAQNPYTFKGGIQDRGSGLIKFGQRWYNALVGSWTQQDTLDAPLDQTNANRYAYAGDDPVNNLDPLGTLRTNSAAES